MEYISFEQFKKMDIRVGTIREVEPIENTDKLLKFQIDFNEKDEEGNKKLRQIISGIHEYYPNYKELVGKQVLYIINLEPRKIKGYVSQGMLMAIDDPKSDNGRPIFLIPEEEANPGAKVH